MRLSSVERPKSDYSSERMTHAGPPSQRRDPTLADADWRWRNGLDRIWTSGARFHLLMGFGTPPLKACSAKPELSWCLDCVWPVLTNQPVQKSTLWLLRHKNSDGIWRVQSDELNDALTTCTHRWKVHTQLPFDLLFDCGFIIYNFISCQFNLGCAGLWYVEATISPRVLMRLLVTFSNWVVTPCRPFKVTSWRSSLLAARAPRPGCELGPLLWEWGRLLDCSFG